MAHYAVVGVTPTSQDWIPAYAREVTKLVEQHGGRYLARTATHTTLEGDAFDHALLVIIEWPSQDAAEAFYHDPAYQAHLQARLAGARNDFALVAGQDDLS
jgi:uncharacterized protein (DUF1330 family)